MAAEWNVSINCIKNISSNKIEDFLTFYSILAMVFKSLSDLALGYIDLISHQILPCSLPCTLTSLSSLEFTKASALQYPPQGTFFSHIFIWPVFSLHLDLFSNHALSKRLSLPTISICDLFFSYYTQRVNIIKQGEQPQSQTAWLCHPLAML